MVDPPVGYRFHPTDEEIVGDYVRPKNIESNTSRVDEVMNTVDIYEFDPWELPYKSRINSTDEVWYFFGCKKDQQNRGERQSRRTKSGFWKKTGVTMDIMRKRGNREKIGEKRVFVFQYSKILGGPSKPKSDWVMHEHVATFLSPDSPNQTMMMMKYTVCKVMFKGDERVLSSSSSSSAGQIQHHHLSLIPHVNSNNSGGLSSETEVDPRQFTGFPHLEEETMFVDEILRGFNNPPTDDWNSLFSNDEEQGNTMFMQEDRNDYRPKMSLTGVFIGHSDDDSDSDSISSRTTTGSIKTSSTCVTFGCSNHPTDLSESPSSSTIESGSVTQEVSEALGTNTVTSERKMNPCDDDAQLSEIGGDKIDQEMVIKNKRAGYIYRMMQKITKKIKLRSCISGT
uniref:NAC domain-containing protein n=1 Tax=Brassica campestris TaxID=3711 RepID=M4EWX3_BRACM